MSETITNKVAESGLVTIDLAEYYPSEEIMSFDLKDYLYMGLILKEKDFRENLKNLQWQAYKNKVIALTCSTDAIIPPWAYMLAVSYLQPIAKDVIMGSEKEVIQTILLSNLRRIDASKYTDQRVVIKGCGDVPIGDFAYMEITKLLRPIAKTIMYGEPCSTVPIYKKNR
ncbi:MAG TPA: DUF2480 family protein [Chitinophagaceae bacterium]|nr:DUF2480 family protein [Chitinophagaceae bacterium]